MAVEGLGVEGLDADGDRVVGRTRLDDDTRSARPSLRQVPAPAGVGSPGTRPDHLGEGPVEAAGVGHLEDEVAELELVLHGRLLGSGQRVGRRSVSEGKSRSVFTLSASSTEPGGSPASARRSAAIAAANSGVKG